MKRAEFLTNTWAANTDLSCERTSKEACFICQGSSFIMQKYNIKAAPGKSVQE